MILRGVRYRDDICKLLVGYEETENRNDVVQSDFEVDSCDVMNKMKTNHVLNSLLVDYFVAL